jgi:hypothetical protein
MPKAVIKPKSGLAASDFFVMENLNKRMRKVHNHDDRDGIESDMRNGIDADDIMKRSCTRCGKPRQDKGDYYYV